MANNNNPNVVFVKFEGEDGGLQIARHERPELLSPDEEIDDFIRDVVHEYKADPKLTYLGLADEDEYEAFLKLKS